eukprot:14453453-Alexandrium_andersonii.AAC.1
MAGPLRRASTHHGAKHSELELRSPRPLAAWGCKPGPHKLGPSFACCSDRAGGRGHQRRKI